MSNRSTNIRVGADTSGIATAVQEVTGSLRALTSEIRNINKEAQVATEPIKQTFQNVKDSSGLAGAAVMSFNGVVSDANYGIRGIANNLQQFSGLMVTLVGQTGSFKAALIALRSAVMGPLGLMLAFTAGISILERFSMKSKKSSDETEENTDLTKANAKALGHAATIRELYNDTLKKTADNLIDVNRLTKEQAIGELQNIKAQLEVEKQTLNIAKEQYQVAWESAALLRDQEKRKSAFDSLSQDAKNITETEAKVQALTNAIKNYQDVIYPKKTGKTVSTKRADTSELYDVKNSIQSINSVYEQLGNTLTTLNENPTFTNPLGKMRDNMFKVTQDVSQMIESLNNSIERFATDTVVGLLGSLGEELGGNTKAFDEWGKNFIASFGGFLQQMGAMIITYGVAMEAFRKAFTNPVAAVAAGAALIVIGGAVKGLHHKKFGGDSGGSVPVSGYMGSSGGYGQGGEIEIYSRIDGRDIVMSSNRSTYTTRR